MVQLRVIGTFTYTFNAIIGYQFDENPTPSAPVWGRHIDEIRFHINNLHFFNFPCGSLRVSLQFDALSVLLCFDLPVANAANLVSFWLPIADRRQPFLETLGIPPIGYFANQSCIQQACCYTIRSIRLVENEIKVTTGAIDIVD